MASWLQRSGYDWQVVVPSEDAPRGTAFVGATLAYGLLDESVTDYGTLRSFMGLVRAELARPVELTGGRVSVPEALVEVSADLVSFSVRGQPEVVASAWSRLASFFATPLQPEPATPAPVDEFGWPRDAEVRCGINAFTLTMLTVEVPAIPVEQLNRLRQHLDPAQGRVRGVFHTSDETLSGIDGFAAAPARTDLPVSDRRGAGAGFPANLRSLPGPVAFTVVVPRSWAGLAACLVLRDHFLRSVHTVTGAAPSVGGSIHGFGADQWFHVVCPEMPAAPDRVRAVTATLTTPVPDVVIDDVVAHVAGLDDTLHERERRVLGLPADTRPDANAVRTAVLAALSTVHIPAESPQQEIGGYPQLMEPLPPESGKQFHSWLVHRDMAAADIPAYVTVGPRVLSQPVSGTSDEVDTVDLSRAALVLERPDGMLTIMDTGLRMVDVRTTSFRNGRRLRTLLDERLTGVPRLPGKMPADATYANELSSRIRTGQRRTVLAFSVLGLFLIFIVVMILVQNLR